MKEQKVILETAKLAKEKGFDWDCDHYFIKEDNSLTKAMYYEMDINNKTIDDDSGYFSSIPLCVAPTQALLAKWLREVYGLELFIHKFKPNDAYPKGYYCVSKPLTYYSNEMKDWIFTNFKTYEEALEVGLQEALKLIK